MGIWTTGVDHHISERQMPEILEGKSNILGGLLLHHPGLVTLGNIKGNRQGKALALIMLKARSHTDGAVAIQTKAIDESLIGRQAEKAGARISTGGKSRNRAQFHKTEAQRSKPIEQLAVLIEAGRQTDGVVQRAPGQRKI